MAQKKFLVIQQKMIGDVLASTVICEGLKSVFPSCIVHFVANHNTLPVLEHHPFIDKVIVFEKIYRSSKIEFFKFLKFIQGQPYYAVIDAYGKLESNLISLFSKATYKVSHPKWYTKWIYNHRIEENLNPDGKFPSALQNRLRLLEPIIGSQTNLEVYPKIYLSTKETTTAKNTVDTLRETTGQPMIMIGILGSSPIKTYPAKYMADILDFICQRTDAKLIFNYIPNQKKEALAVYHQCKKETRAQIAIDFYAESLREFLAILDQCDALIGNEGGAVNMAKALNIPTFCVFSPFIVKGAWHVDNSKKHMGVHLKDHRPQVFENRNKKSIKKDIETLYTSFEPELFKKDLARFIVENLDDKKETTPQK